jgi:hypothetical protein
VTYHRASLQDPSHQAPITRGVVIDVAIGDGAGLVPPQILRLAEGTWSILVARLVQGARGLTIARAPSQLDPAWPVTLTIIHGRGAAGWTEELLCAARGTQVVRSDDYMQCQLTLGGAGWATADRILLAATQLIAIPLPAHVSETVIADGLGVATIASIPPCSQTMQLIGAQGGGTVVTWLDSGGATIGVSGSVPVAASIHVPTMTASVIITGLAAGAAVTATYEVLQ